MKIDHYLDLILLVPFCVLPFFFCVLPSFIFQPFLTIFLQRTKKEKRVYDSGVDNDEKLSKFLLEISTYSSSRFIGDQNSRRKKKNFEKIFLFAYIFYDTCRKRLFIISIVSLFISIDPYTFSFIIIFFVFDISVNLLSALLFNKFRNTMEYILEIENYLEKLKYKVIQISYLILILMGCVIYFFTRNNVKSWNRSSDIKCTFKLNGENLRRSSNQSSNGNTTSTTEYNFLAVPFLTYVENSQNLDYCEINDFNALEFYKSSLIGLLGLFSIFVTLLTYNSPSNDRFVETIRIMRTYGVKFPYIYLGFKTILLKSTQTIISEIESYLLFVKASKEYKCSDDDEINTFLDTSYFQFTNPYEMGVLIYVFTECMLRKEKEPSLAKKVARTEKTVRILLCCLPVNKITVTLKDSIVIALKYLTFFGVILLFLSSIIIFPLLQFLILYFLSNFVWNVVNLFVFKNSFHNAFKIFGYFIFYFLFCFVCNIFYHLGIFEEKIDILFDRIKLFVPKETSLFKRIAKVLVSSFFNIIFFFSLPSIIFVYFLVSKFYEKKTIFNHNFSILRYLCNEKIGESVKDLKKKHSFLFETEENTGEEEKDNFQYLNNRENVAQIKIDTKNLKELELVHLKTKLELRRLKIEMNGLKRDLEKIKVFFEGKKKDHENIKKKIKKTKKKLLKKRKLLDKKREELSKLKENLEKAQKDLQAASLEYEKQKVILGKVKLECEKLKKNKREVKMSLQEFENQLKKYESEIEKMKIVVDGLQKHQDTRQLKLESIKQKIKTQEVGIEIEKKHVEMIEVEFLILKKEIKEMENHNYEMFEIYEKNYSDKISGFGEKYETFIGKTNVKFSGEEKKFLERKLKFFSPENFGKENSSFLIEVCKFKKCVFQFKRSRKVFEENHRNFKKDHEKYVSEIKNLEKTGLEIVSRVQKLEKMEDDIEGKKKKCKEMEVKKRRKEDKRNTILKLFEEDEKKLNRKNEELSKSQKNCLEEKSKVLETKMKLKKAKMEYNEQKKEVVTTEGMVREKREIYSEEDKRVVVSERVYGIKEDEVVDAEASVDILQETVEESENEEVKLLEQFLKAKENLEEAEKICKSQQLDVEDCEKKKMEIVEKIKKISMEKAEMELEVEKMEKSPNEDHHKWVDVLNEMDDKEKKDFFGSFQDDVELLNSNVVFLELVEENCRHDHLTFLFYYGKHKYIFDMSKENEESELLYKIKTYKSKCEIINKMQFQLGFNFCKFLLVEKKKKKKIKTSKWEKDVPRIYFFNKINGKLEKFLEKAEVNFEIFLRNVKKNKDLVNEIVEKLAEFNKYLFKNVQIVMRKKGEDSVKPEIELESRRKKDKLKEIKEKMESMLNDDLRERNKSLSDIYEKEEHSIKWDDNDIEREERFFKKYVLDVKKKCLEKREYYKKEMEEKRIDKIKRESEYEYEKLEMKKLENNANKLLRGKLELEEEKKEKEMLELKKKRLLSYEKDDFVSLKEKYFEDLHLCLSMPKYEELLKDKNAFEKFLGRIEKANYVMLFYYFPYILLEKELSKIDVKLRYQFVKMFERKFEELVDDPFLCKDKIGLENLKKVFKEVLPTNFYEKKECFIYYEMLCITYCVKKVEDGTKEVENIEIDEICKENLFVVELKELDYGSFERLSWFDKLLILRKLSKSCAEMSEDELFRKNFLALMRKICKKKGLEKELIFGLCDVFWNTMNSVDGKFKEDLGRMFEEFGGKRKIFQKFKKFVVNLK